MRFERFIQALDMGQCEDQIQREAIFDLALMFVMIDGVVDKSEVEFMRQWLASLQWKSDISKEDYYQAVRVKCESAIQHDELDHFIAHRARMLTDPLMRQQALQLANDIAHVDGHLDDTEAQAIEQLKDLLAD